MSHKSRTKLAYSLLLFVFECVILITSLSPYDDDYPRFYHLSESTPPTQSILNNLTFYQEEWHKVQHDDGFEQTYTFTMCWDCAPCDPCLLANKFIHVQNNVIETVETSKINDQYKKGACNDYNKSDEMTQYETIDELYQMVINYVQTGLTASDPKQYMIHELMIHRTYYFPIAVKLSQSKGFIAWKIECFEPFHVNSEDDVCEYTATSNESEKKWTFWITQEMQSFLGWSMIFLILVACSLGYCINWLKKKKSEKIEAWREKEERQREEREREKDSKSKTRKKGKGKRKSSKAKHRAHLEKSRKQKNNRDKSDHEYSKVDHSSDDEQQRAHYDVQEEQITPN